MINGNRFSQPLFFLRSVLPLFLCSNRWLIIMLSILAVSGLFDSHAQGKQLVDFVVCIDNSASIQGQDQTLIRETTMLLADLADEGDRISVLTFGRGAQTVAIATIKSDEDKKVFKRQALQGIHFRDSFSDIGALFKELTQKRAELFRPTEAISAVILLSDGKLEPENKNPQAGLATMQDALANQLKDININAVVLGNTSCFDPIPRMTHLNGLQLMQDYVAKTPEYLKHAEKLDQLFEIVLNILNQTKGISSLGDEDKARFLLDDTVESMTLIIRKKDANGQPLGTSQNIEVKHDTGDQGNPVKTFSAANSGNSRLIEGSATGVYWSADYQYFDLVVIRKPAGGHWSVEMTNGLKAEVLNKIVSPIQLRFNRRDIYYSGEKASLTAWIYNGKTDTVVTDKPFKIQARLAIEKPVEDSKLFQDLVAAEKGKYLLAVPENLKEILSGKTLPATVHVELIAQSYSDPKGTNLDPWFIRRTPQFSFQVMAPIFQSIPKPEKLLTMPILSGLTQKLTGIPDLTDHMKFGGSLDGRQTQTFPFDLLPFLRVKIERLDDKGMAAETVWEETLNGSSEGSTSAVYTGSPATHILKAGSYQVTYQLSGTRKNGGALTLEVPTQYFQVVSYAWVIYRVIIPLLIGLALFIVSSRTATLKGRIIKNGQGRSIHCRTYAEPGFFRLNAVRIFYVYARIRITSLGQNVIVNGSPLPITQSRGLEPNKRHRIVCGQDEFEIMLTI